MLGTFDLGVDVFGLLSGNVRVELPGKWSFSVQSLEVVVPDVVTVTAEGISIKYDPADADPNQEIVRIDEAVIQFQRFAVRGTIRTFDPTPGPLGTAGATRSPASSSAATASPSAWPSCATAAQPRRSSPATIADDRPAAAADARPLTPNDRPGGKIRLAGILEFDDIRFIVENFSFTVGTDVDFDGSIAIASGGARLFPGRPFTATITDR